MLYSIVLKGHQRETPRTKKSHFTRIQEDTTRFKGLLTRAGMQFRSQRLDVRIPGMLDSLRTIWSAETRPIALAKSNRLMLIPICKRSSLQPPGKVYHIFRPR